MASVSLKSLLGKRTDTAAVIGNLLQALPGAVCIEDAGGTVLAGEPPAAGSRSFPVRAEDQVVGSVRGGEGAEVLAALLTQLAQKEAEKKRLGNEVLNLYHEINLIFNFSEKLAQAIEADQITRLALDEAVHSIPCSGGIVVLWNEEARQLQVPAQAGEPLFDSRRLQDQASRLLQIGLSGQSEILSDLGPLREAGVLQPDVQALLYAALKVKHRIMGAIILASRDPFPYTAGHLKLLVTLALQSSSAIESALQYEKNIREAREREENIRRIHEVTKKFVPYEFIRSLGRDELTDLRLGDQVEKVVTVLFTDIRDYTTLAEQMTPEENFRFVNRFNGIMGPIIRRHRGFVNQYLGDAIMAIFPENATQALVAAIEMREALRLFNEERQQQGRAPLRIGIGMHTGPLIMGITGDLERMDATTIADAVNTASRLESLTKYYRASIILSDATLQQMAAPDQFCIRHLGKVQLKGKLNVISIHECFNGDPPDDLARKSASIPVFNEGLHHYLNRSFDQAVAAFSEVASRHPGDQTARLFLANALQYLEKGLPDNWSGALAMQEK
ncbi:MAG TPA: adenylate/guanylate cyclase domain-containing protein [Chitinophagaceae bacterium]|nr:adenylate/guanylate cyclase domain-containing protein [Chitinophagaceae bacterium]